MEYKENLYIDIRNERDACDEQIKLVEFTSPRMNLV